MSNKYSEHLQVLVEDDANRQLINGLNRHPSIQARMLQLLPVAGGWKVVLDSLGKPELVRQLAELPKRHLLLLIDFDEQFESRSDIYQKHKQRMPVDVSQRIYLLGCLHEPEKLKADLQSRRSFEEIGRELADDCAPPPAPNLWQHPHLQHNAQELQRLVAQVKPFLFKP